MTMTILLSLGLLASYIILGKDKDSGAEVGFDSECLARHIHLIGSTGSGKTTAILTIIRQILTATYEKACLFIIDPMGNLSLDLMRWIANSRYCPSAVRKRLLYIEPAREDVVLPFNPLIYQTPAHEYYQVERTISLILRAWESQELSAMPRLRKWCFNAFLAVARLQLPIAVCHYLLQPGSREHDALLNLLPPDIKYEWHEILRSRGNEAIRILESTRNRLDPFFRSVILKRMFGSRRSHFDVERFIRERRIVILNLASYRRIPRHLTATIGSLALNEILETTMNLPREIVRPTYILLDEFQFFCGPDIYEAIPIVRQQGVRLILSHQSFAQLELGEIDLTGLIWQPRNRLMFACDADDADRLAHELAHLTFDPMTIKHQLRSHKQRIAGHRVEQLKTWSSAHGTTSNWQEGHGRGRADNRGEVRPPNVFEPTRSSGSATNQFDSSARGGGTTNSESSGAHEVNVPIHEDFEELSSVTFKSFDEERTEWGKVVRTASTGQAIAKIYDDPNLHHVLIDEDPIPDSLRLRDAVQELIQRNFESDVFVSAAQLDHEAEEIRLSLLQPPRIILSADSVPLDPAQPLILPPSSADNSGLE